MLRIGRRLITSSAAKRRSRGETHGMQIRLSEACLNAAKTDDLERLAAWLGVTPPAAEDRRQRRALIIAILREEGRLSSCHREKRWMRKDQTES
jgi:hypothetical protein